MSSCEKERKERNEHTYLVAGQRGSEEVDAVGAPAAARLLLLGAGGGGGGFHGY